MFYRDTGSNQQVARELRFGLRAVIRDYLFFMLVESILNFVKSIVYQAFHLRYLR
jgi:hypothetical protein